MPKRKGAFFWGVFLKAAQLSKTPNTTTFSVVFWVAAVWISAGYLNAARRTLFVHTAGTRLAESKCWNKNHIIRYQRQ